MLEGRYDGYLSIELAYKKNVTAPDAPYKDYKNNLTYIRYKALPTYVLVNKNDKELARQINQALGELKKEARLPSLRSSTSVRKSARFWIRNKNGMERLNKEGYPWIRGHSARMSY